jgi:hypothetical protein
MMTEQLRSGRCKLAKVARWGTIAAGLILFLLVPAGYAQISPGPLSRAHKTLDSAANCTSCHKLGAMRTLKCLECHTEIASRLRAGHGLHASYNLKADSSQECARCHSEHNGENFEIIKWTPTPAGFDHSKTGYNLVARHAGLACNRCHTPAHIAPNEMLSIQVRDKTRTFLGVSPNCVNCHKDEHGGRLGPNCQQCHNFEDWKNVAQFDHNKTRYPLTGLHAQVTCAKCHTPGPDNKPRYTGLAFSACTDCHSDPHHGSFAQQSCQSCHNTAGWKRVSLQTVNERFDHSKTKYPLEGKHQALDCLRCHTSGDFKKPLAFQYCLDCHKDEHDGQFVKRADKGECAACHNLQGFKPTTFGVKEHGATAYPLVQKHATVECAKCHIPKGKDTVYHMKFAQCMDCHRDEHRGQFAGVPYLNRCEQCHDLKGYRPATFTLAKHKQTRFALTGGHMATPCGDCHQPWSELKGDPAAVAHYQHLEKAAVFRFEDRSCTVCHADPHHGQFKDRMLVTSASGAPSGCEACHNTESWQDLRAFDHSRTSFPLLGAHRGTACIDCHKPSDLGTRLVQADFKAAPTKCEQCHQDVHGLQFANASKITSCADCHNSFKWRPSLFDHERRTAFSLKGAHQNVRCEACHKNIQTVSGKSVLFYKPTPKDCAACHGPVIPKQKLSP